MDRLDKTPGDSFIAAMRNGNYILTPKVEAIAPLLDGLPIRQRQLGVAQLHTVVLDHLLLRSDPGPYPRDRQHPVLSRRYGSCRFGRASGQADIAFLIKPITLDQLRDISLSGNVMPQKIPPTSIPNSSAALAIYALD